MFFKKKPSDSDGVELVPEKGFGLFVKPASPDSAAPAPLRSARPRGLPRAPAGDVIDVEPIDRGRPVTSTPQPAAPGQSPPVEAQPLPPVATAAGPAAGMFAGLKVTKNPPRAPEPAAAPATHVAEPAQKRAFSLGGAFGKKAPSESAPAPAQPTVTDAPAAQSKGFSLKGSFGKKPEAKDGAAASAPLAAKAPGFSFAGSFGKKTPAAPDAATKAKAVKAPKASMPAKRAGPPANSLDVLVHLDGGREVFWRITASGMHEVAVTDVLTAVSFTRGDFRFSVPAALSNGAARDFVLSEVGEPVRVLNTSSALLAVYAAAVSRVVELAPVVVAPGLLVLEQLLKVERQPDEPVLCTLVLSDSQTSQSLVVLYYFSPEGEVSAVQVTANADNLNFVISQFAATHRLDLAHTKAVLFKNEDLLKGASYAQYFPVDATVLGVSATKLMKRAPFALAVLAGATVLFAGQAYGTKALASREHASLVAQQTKLQSQLNVGLLDAVTSFARTQSVDVTQTMTRARAFWVPLTTVVAEATPAKEEYRITLQLVRADSAGGAALLLGQRALEDLSPLLSNQPIKGCVKSAPGISGGLNALQTTITCEAGSSYFSDYWPG